MRFAIVHASRTEKAMNRRSFIVAGMGLVTTTVIGCESTPGTPQEADAKRREIDAGVDSALAQLYAVDPSARQLGSKAEGILVFPSVTKAGLVVGGEYGEGALRIRNQTVGYYSATAGSIGLQAGAQTKSVIMMFMTKSALDQFRASDGWTAGADASVALINTGASGSVDTSTAQQPVVGFVQTRSGLMFDASIDGTKISPLKV
jgi:lipid-binding SYLF domain-containing protein